jgi:hypothetical protein
MLEEIEGGYPEVRPLVPGCAKEPRTALDAIAEGARAGQSVYRSSFVQFVRKE